METLKKLMILLFIIALFLSSTPALAVPPFINFQGKLTDANGSPVADGSYSMTFRLFSTLTGGSALWTEDQNLQVTGGVYYAQLGNAPFPVALFDNDNLFLEVSITGETLAPRQRITSTAFAMRGGVKNETVNSAMIQNGSVKAEDLEDGAALAEIKNNAGDGSGLDADMVDGKHAADLENRIAQLETTVAQLTALLQSVTRSGTDIYFDGVNVHVRNGLGSTSSKNGAGNLIVGYNEVRGSGDVRDGSHNIVVGQQLNFSS